MFLLQLLLGDVAGVLSKHPSGTPVETDHNRLLFGAHRAHAYTNERVSAFIAFALFALAFSASADWLNGL